MSRWVWLNALKKIKLPEIKWSPLTLLALGCGAGAAFGCGLLAWWWLPVLVGLWSLCSLRGKVALLSGFSLCLISAAVTENRNRELFAGLAYGIERCDGVLEITDVRCTAVGNVNRAKNIRAKFTSATADREYRVLASFPEERSEFAGEKLFFGDRFQVSGILIPPSSAGYEFDGQHITENELPPPYGKSILFQVREAERKSSVNSLRRSCFKLRDLILERLLYRIDDRDMRSCIARFFTGCTSGGSPEINNRMALAGIIHIFAVSGLHVGILAWLCFLVCGFRSFRVRCRVTAAVILFYVLLTGSSVPTVRAGVMISGFLLLRSLLYYMPAWNILMLVWSVFIFFYPQECAGLGVQYSFGITAALVIVFEQFSRLRRDCSFLPQLMTGFSPESRRYHRQQKRAAALLAAIMVPVTAFFAGVMISLSCQRLLLPGSMVANLPLPLILPVCFALAICKIAVGAWWGWADALLAAGLNGTFRLLEHLAVWCSGVFSNIGTVPVSRDFVVLYYIAFFAALSARTFRQAAICGSVVLAMVVIPPWCHRFSHGEIYIYSSGSDQPAMLVICPGRGREAVVCDVPDSWCGAVAGRDLREAGVTGCRVVVSRGRVGNIRGLNALNRQVPVTALAVPEKCSRFFRKETAGFANLRREFPGKIMAESDPDSGRVFWHCEQLCILSEITGEGRKITITLSDGKTRCAVIPWSEKILRWKVVFSR